MKYTHWHMGRVAANPAAYFERSAREKSVRKVEKMETAMRLAKIDSTLVLICYQISYFEVTY